MTLPWGLVMVGLALGYLMGSIPFGLLFTRAAGLGDVRAIGSGNIGATNVLRTGRRDIAAATVLCDALKGTVPVLVAARWLGPEAGLAAALGAFLGHCFPVWLGFRGGKGVATFIGCLIALDWRAALAFAAIWLGVAFASRYSSAASLAASAATPIVLWAFGNVPAGLLMAVVAVLLWAKHGQNIARLRAGTEGRIGRRG